MDPVNDNSTIDTSTFPSGNFKIIPPNHNVVGTCGKCGGPIIKLMYSLDGSEPREYCMDCGSVPKKEIIAVYGPVKEMQ